MTKEDGAYETSIVIRNIICTALAFLVLLAALTGWLYDLWAGTGTEQECSPKF